MLTEAISAPVSASSYPACREAIPDGVLVAGRYALRFAKDAGDLERVQRLRFEVFNLELNEGLDSAYLTGRDEDALDAACHHMLVEHRASGQVVGTYRLMLQPMARARGGFYSEAEFDFSGLPPEIQGDGVELGRACVHRDHRNGRVIHLLWRGLGRYLGYNDKRYLFGCCSLPTLDPEVGATALELLRRRGSLHPRIHLAAQPRYRCPLTRTSLATLELPPLMESYLSLGARAASEPAVDEAFKVIDFFVLLDVEAMDPRVRHSLSDSSRWR
jgi:putative hemolysin